jgi:hypothetical protein
VTFCTSSDDSIQVSINNLVVTNVSSCRGSAADCSERRAWRPCLLESRESPSSYGKAAAASNFRLAIEVDWREVTDANAGGLRP